MQTPQINLAWMSQNWKYRISRKADLFLHGYTLKIGQDLLEILYKMESLNQHEYQAKIG